MPSLPIFVAKLIAPDGYEDKKYFDTKAAAEKWISGEGKLAFDGDIQRAEIHHRTDGLVWVKDSPKVEQDVRYKQMHDPNSLLRHSGLPKPRPKPHIEAYCEKCQCKTMNWREYETKWGIPLRSKPLLECSECHKVVPDHAPRP